MQTMQQERAKYALEQVSEKVDALKSRGKNEFKSYAKEFKSYAAALPAMIHMNGLGQAAAFFHAKGGTHGDLYQLLSNWLCQKDQPFFNRKDMLDGITNSDMQTYRLAQVEAQALMSWVTKFAKAYMAEKDDPNKKNDQNIDKKDDPKNDKKEGK